MHLQFLLEYSLWSQRRELHLKMEADTASFGTPEFWMDCAQTEVLILRMQFSVFPTYDPLLMPPFIF